MEEKKGIKAGSVFLAIAIIVIIVMGYFIFKFYNEKTVNEENISNLNYQISNLENTVNDLQNKIDESTNTSEDESNTVQNNVVSNSNSTSNSTITDISEIKDLLKNESTYEYLKISSVQKENDKYLVKADYYVPIPITEKQYSEIVKNGSVVLNGQEYVYSKENNKEYVYIQGEPVEGGYAIEKVDNDYIFVREVGGVYNIINEVKKQYSFNLDKDVKVSEIASDIEDVSLGEYLSKDENKDLSKFNTVVNYDESKDEIVIDVDKR